jgi:Na+/H+ antiporter NhaD/arsenite permease-like protein
MALPFAALLAMIAAGPLFVPRWWAAHFAKVVLALAASTVALYFAGLGGAGQEKAAWIARRMGEAGREYFSFIALIGSLYVVSGGIHIRVKSGARPLANTGFLLGGALLANILGTTGASMLLIRPWLKMNRGRVAPHHVAFFIFIVSNVGGGLTPIGDPPLLAGWLHGVPFWWLAENGWRIWATAVAVLLGMFLVIDSRAASRLPVATPAGDAGSWGVEGLGNLVFLAVILAAVFVPNPPFLREALMIGASAGSHFATPKSIHVAQGYNFHPLREVAFLFAGIFATMAPALDWIGARAHSWRALGAEGLYWGTGSLSSVLDNMPTYLAFLRAAGGDGDIRRWLGEPAFQRSLLAISYGAVFFGANTYIGNGPNLMVRSIAAQLGARPPGFVAFTLRHALPIMGPVVVFIWWGFFRN